MEGFNRQLAEMQEQLIAGFLNLRTITRGGDDERSFIVDFKLDYNVGGPYQLAVTVEELQTFSAFQAACFTRSGVMARHEAETESDGVRQWNADVDAAIWRGRESQ